MRPPPCKWLACLLSLLQLKQTPFPFTLPSDFCLLMKPGHLFHLFFTCVHSQLCPTLCDPMDCNSTGSSVQGISQARVLEWVAIPSSKASSQPGIKPASPVIPALGGRFFTTGPPLFTSYLMLPRASLLAQLVKNLPGMQETQVQFLGWKDPLEKEVAIQSGIFAWKIPWIEKSGRLQFIGLHRVEHSWATNTFSLLSPNGLHHFLIRGLTHLLLYLFPRTMVLLVWL